MYRIQIRLKEYLLSIDVSLYQLGQWTQGVSWQTVYAIASGTRRPSLEVIEIVINTLRLRGYPTELADILRLERTSD